MADQEDEDLQMAIRMSMQHSPPEPKRSKPRDAAVSGIVSGSPEESPEAKSRRLQRELMAAAAEKRMMAAKSVSSPVVKGGKAGEVGRKDESPMEGGNLSKELSLEEANQLFLMVFGSEVSKGILAQWSNQGIRYLQFLVGWIVWRIISVISLLLVNC